MMTAEQKVKWLILASRAGWAGEDVPEYPCSEIDELYDDAENQAADYFYDAKYEIRRGEAETGLPAPDSRHYSCKSVAMQLPDGSWVGWPYWFGGGKHGEPYAIDWIEDAYDVTCVEETRVVRVFSVAAYAEVAR